MSVHVIYRRLWGKTDSLFKMCMFKRDCQEIQFQIFIMIKPQELTMTRLKNYVLYFGAHLMSFLKLEIENKDRSFKRRIEYDNYFIV